MQTKQEKAEYNRAYCQKNKEKLAAKRKTYYQKNKEEKNEKAAIYRQKNRFQISINNGKNSAKLRGHEPVDATKEQIEEAFTGVCDCCGISEENIDKKLGTDHCHVTGKFRGWLCNKCNVGIGKLGDNIQGVKQAISYLEKTYES